MEYFPYVIVVVVGVLIVIMLLLLNIARTLDDIHNKGVEVEKAIRGLDSYDREVNVREAIEKLNRDIESQCRRLGDKIDRCDLDIFTKDRIKSINDDINKLNRDVVEAIRNRL